MLDLVLVLVLAAYAWSGWRQGFVSAVLGLVGLVGGAYLAVRFVPTLLEEHFGIYRATAAGVLALLAAVLGAAVLGQGLMLLLARRFRDVVTAPAARAVDSALGLVAVLMTALLVVWVIGGAVRTHGPAAAREAVSRSAVISALDDLVPTSADGLVDDVSQALDRGFPQVFEGLGPEPIAPVQAPGCRTGPGPRRRRGARLGRARAGGVRLVRTGPGGQRLGRLPGAGRHQRARRGRRRPGHRQPARHRP